MANLSHSDSRRLYSWWWDSHNTPKNSKWLQENITDMDGRVKSMIKLIEEDADSFARKAEMYYKKRPELMKLVEEFYRAYRALAERYNHATGELRHYHRALARAFPDQVPFELVEDSPSKSSAQDWELEENDPILTVLDANGMLESMGISAPGESDGGMKRRGLKQLHEMCGAKETATQSLRRGPKNEKDEEESSQDAVLQLSTENQNLKDKILSETERAGRAESEVLGLKKALADMEAEKEDILHQYQQCLERLPKIEGDLSNAKMDSKRLNEKASRAEIEVQTLKEALLQLESEKNADMVKQKEYLEKISNLEAIASRFQQDMETLNNKTVAAENQAETLKDEISILELEKEAVVHRHKENLARISELETIISSKEGEMKMLKKQAERAESEATELKRAVDDLNKQKEASAFQYKHCLETIAKLEKDLSIAKDEVEHQKNLVFIGTSKVKTTEEKCNLLAVSNHALRSEADDLAKKIAMKDEELLSKQEELEKLQSCLQDDNTRHAQVEATLETLQKLHAQSQDDQRALATELRNMLKMLEDVKASKHDLEEEIQKVRDENHILSESSLCSSVSMENMQNEVLSLREIRERLEKEVSHHMGISISLQNEIFRLKEEIELLNKSYQALVEQVEAAGLNPNFIGTSIKSLQDENSKLKQMQAHDYSEKEILLKKIENIEEVLKKKSVAERSLSDLNAQLEMSCEKVKALQESCQLLHGEKITLIAEKASLLSQLQAITENMNSLVGQNAVLEHSLSAAKVELEGLRKKSKGLEEICDLLKNERSFLSSERESLVLKLANVERKLESLEKKFTRLGEKYADLEKENETMHFQVEKLKVSLGEEKQEWIDSQLLSETRMAGLENEIHRLQEENKSKKRESEQELEKALKAQFEISTLHKFIKDMENKNCALIIECQKHVDASNLAEKVISELESESLEQQMETELLLDEIGRLRSGIYQIFASLESIPDSAPENRVENERTLVQHILECVEDMKCVISKHEDEKLQLVVENSVLEALLEQLQFKGMEIELQKVDLDQEAKIVAEKLAIVKGEKEELLEINRQLKSDASKGYVAAAMLQAELGRLGVKQGDLQIAYNALQEAYSRAKQENACLLKKLYGLIEEKCRVDQLNDDILMDLLAAINQSEVLKSFAIEKIVELRSLLEDLNRQRDVNSCLEREMNELGSKLDLQKTENLAVKDAVCSLEREMQEIKQCNDQMKQEIANSTEVLTETKAKLFDTAMQLEATEKLNSALFRTVAELRIDIQESQLVRDDLEKNMVQLSETNSSQMKEIQGLHKVNENLEYELVLLHQEIEENIVREQTLSIELQGMNKEFELWEAEAETFCFDLQVSSIQEVLLKNMVQELTGVCQTLEHKHAAKTSEIKQMKEKFSLIENEIDRLKSQVSAYSPVIASLRDDITLMEHNALLHSKLKATPSQGEEFLEFVVHPNEATSQTPLEDQSLPSLQDLQRRVKAIGRLMEETNRPVSQRRSNPKCKQEPVVCDDLLKMQSNLGKDKKTSAGMLNDSPRLPMKSKASEVRNMMLMKDIPLDQASDTFLQNKSNASSDDPMLELWETVEDGNRDQTTSGNRAYDQVEYMKGKSYLQSTDSDIEKELGVDKLELSSRFAEPSPELNDETILEKLASDAEKLESLQTILYNFRRKADSNKKSRKAKNIDFDAVKKQLQEAEDTLVHLVDLNVQLVNNIEECPPDEMVSPRMKGTVKTWRIKVMEQAQKGSERLDMLQLAVQRIQLVLSKLDDEGKISKGNNKFLRSRNVILRDFIYNGKRNSGRRRKRPNCGCFKQSTSGTEAVRR